MMGLLAIPGMIVRVLLMTALWLIGRPGGWFVACCLGIAATWYIKA